MDCILHDLRHAVRRLAASPGFAVSALATLALGIGANTAMFTLVNAVMLRPLAVERPDRLVEVYTTFADGVRRGRPGEEAASSHQGLQTALDPA